MSAPVRRLSLERRPSALSAAAAKVEGGEAKLTVRVPPATLKALKRRALDEGTSVQAFLIRLLAREGIS